jgi:hypothetical protein
METIVQPILHKNETFHTILSTIVDEIERVEELYISEGVVFIKDGYYDDSFKIGTIPDNINSLVMSGRLKIKSWKITGDIENKNDLGLLLKFE